ncbi:acyl carrier protein [Streptomyces sp. CSDS2]|uniref:acyl carrier protein n=1 Tax=Streptomyces sp. CSDS2 TaxID=3055051 RepID=UPI0025AF56B2|nr:acyl carrier protein [Streptomyces sp. CSDS2]MDN3259806.1 acyl carrier protein [Streptomyces sp. CSDS2]
MSTDVGGELTAIWRQVFGIAEAEVDLAESFFEIGGTSLQAVQLMTRIEQAFGVKVPLPVIFTEGSIEGLTAAVEEALDTAADDDLLASVEGLSEEEALRLLQEHEAQATADRTDT